MSIPRIRGRTAQIEEPAEDKGKWAYEVSMWDLGGETLIGEPWLFGPFETEAVAKEFGRQKIRQMCDVITEGAPNDRYLDLKNGGVMRPWEDHG